jgi:hypothetical protein
MRTMADHRLDAARSTRRALGRIIGAVTGSSTFTIVEARDSDDGPTCWMAQVVR